MVLSKMEKITRLLPESQSLYQKQIQYAIYKNGVGGFMAITTIPKQLRQRLKEKLGNVLSLKSIYEMEGGQAHKVLFETRDGARIEAVRMLFRPTPANSVGRNDFHESLCISSQSGCALGCRFCATGDIGFKKNLTAEEISDQVIFFKSKGYQIGSISFMGMGEPLANPHIFAGLTILTHPDFLGISQRRISISTVGITLGIKRLTKEFPQVNLAFSLHSPFEDQRRELMPISKAYPIKEVFAALDERIKLTNRRVFIAYLLLAGVNDTPRYAQALADLIKERGRHCYLYHVNLIRYNQGPGLSKFKPAPERCVKDFIKVLERNNIGWSLRQSFGQKIFAACGQLYGGYRYEK